MLDGIIILWFVLSSLSLVYIIYDLIKITPEAPIMKLAWVLVTLYTGPIGLFFYLITCKEPMEKSHEKFIAPLWKQALGSEVHCLAGDATGIIAAAIALSFFSVPKFAEIIFEYIAGFAFGLLIFQALFMKRMMGGNYIAAVKKSWFPEWLSMNMIMAGMIPVMVIWPLNDPLAKDPRSFHFWAMMSLASIIGGITAYPINYWLVKKKLKHGMTTVRKEIVKEENMSAQHEHHMMEPSVSFQEKRSKAIITLIALALGSLIATLSYFIK